MGLFDKLFGKRQGDYSPSAELMPEEKFWAIVQSSFDKTNGDFEEQQIQLASLLKSLALQEIILFDNRFRELRGRAYNWQLWAAIYIIHGGCGDDSFMDFRDWVIAQGNFFYYRTISDPETLAEVETERIEIEWEGMGYIPSTVFKKLTGKEIPSEYRENQEITGTEWEDDSDTLKNMFPKLYAKYSRNYDQ
ncbi:MAG: DUF4240 domain-containing protein [Cytophagaceae bacterium]